MDTLSPLSANGVSELEIIFKRLCTQYTSGNEVCQVVIMVSTYFLVLLLPRPRHLLPFDEFRHQTPV